MCVSRNPEAMPAGVLSPSRCNHAGLVLAEKPDKNYGLVYWSAQSQYNVSGWGVVSVCLQHGTPVRQHYKEKHKSALIQVGTVVI